MLPDRRYYGQDLCVVEPLLGGLVPGSFPGVPGNGGRIRLGLPHLWRLCFILISRENVWTDGGSGAARLTSEKEALLG